MSCRKALLALALAFLMAGAAAYGKSMSVTVKETQARETPTFLGKIVGTLSYGDRVEVLEEKGGWAQIILPGRKTRGWVHLSALTTQRIVLKAGSAEAQQAASSREVALAGKGFNKEVEQQYREKKKLDYAWVDRMEQFRVSSERIAEFSSRGELSIMEGGDR